MAANRVITKRLYQNQNSRNENYSLDWSHVYNGYPYGSTWNPPRMRVDLVSPSSEPVLYHPQGFGGSASSATFVNARYSPYQPIQNVNVPSVPAMQNVNVPGSWNNGINNIYGNYIPSNYML
jgi:hypothetical protein